MANFRVQPLEDLVTDIIDRRGVTPRKLGGEFTSSGYRVISARSIRNRSIDLTRDDERYVSEEMYHRWMKTPLRRGDVLLTSEAPLGEPAFVNDGEAWCVGQRLFAIRSNPARLSGRFLFYALQAKSVRQDMVSRATGTTVVGIRQSELRRVGIPTPPLNEQEAIAHMLETLDDKIELNRRMNKTLEDVARAMFTAWFITAETSAFPLRLREARRSTWPEGVLGDIAAESREIVDPTNVPPDTPYFGLDHMPRRSIGLETWGMAKGLASSKLAFEAGDILFGKLRPYFHKVGVTPVPGICSTDIVVISPTIDYWFGYVLCIVSSDAFVSHTDASSTGTRMPRTNWKSMASYKISIPTVEVAREFNSALLPIVERLNLCIRQNQTLAAIRDTLLPKLISGELRVPDAERIVSEVT